jgi:Rrf2 family protein
MKSDNRLSAVLHALLHMADHGSALTSADLAKMMSTNPVVVRRTMAGLREAGFVRSQKGHGGGWELARNLDSITLRDIYNALGAPRLLAVGLPIAHAGCLVEQAVNRSLAKSFAEAEALLVERLGSVTLAELAEDFSASARHRRHHTQDHKHA